MYDLRGLIDVTAIFRTSPKIVFSKLTTVSSNLLNNLL